LDVNCIILAGGKSARLGRNKLLEEVGGRNLLEIAVTRLLHFKGDIIVVTGLESVLPELGGYPGLKVVHDIIPGKGSLGGLYSGLRASERQYNLAVACDMPFLNLALFEHMAGLAEKYDAVVPLVNEMVEPLHAVYSKSCLPAMQQLIEKNRLSITELYSMIKVRYIESEDIEKFDPRHLSFFNINNEADLKAGREIANKEDVRFD
jgi:molybdenum cofactor guanylyltransferase